MTVTNTTLTYKTFVFNVKHILFAFIPENKPTEVTVVFRGNIRYCASLEDAADAKLFLGKLTTAIQHST